MNTLFDQLEGVIRKEAGMEQAAENKASLLAFARGLAVEIAEARESRECTADDVQAALQGHGISVRALGNAAGSLFRGGRWEWTGRWVTSSRPHAHCNLIRVWRLVPC